MKTAITIICCLFISSVLAQDEVKITSEKGDENQVLIYVENQASYEQSVQLDVTLKGMKSSEKTPITRVLQPNTRERFLTLTPEPNKSYSYKYSYVFIQGDVTASHDDTHIYQLPFKKGTKYLVAQTYNERPTHMNQNAVDFNMPEGSEITAVRDGVVTRVVDRHNRGCPSKECSDYNNFVLIKHEDGSVADYSHIKKNGSLVKEGDKVKAGERIALSGSTGWASGPHLHFEIYVMSFDGQKSVPAKYYLNGNTVGIPQSGNEYMQGL